MKWDINRCYEKLKDKYDYEEFMKEIEDRYKEYGELVERDVIAYMILDENGRNEITEKCSEISKIHYIRDILNDENGNTSVNLHGIVVDKKDKTSFTRKDGSSGAVSSFLLYDGTAQCRVVMWDEQANKITDFNIGDTVEIKNGYIKNNIRNIEKEIHITTRSTIRKI